MFFSIDEWVIDIFNHVTENSNRIRSHFTEKNFFVICLVDVDLTKINSTFFLFSGRLRRNQTALSLILSVSP